MIPYKIKAGDEELSFSFPSDWSEVTFWQIAQLNAGDISPLDELSIFSGVERRIINNLSSTYANYLSTSLQNALLKEEVPDFPNLEPVFRFKLGRKFIELPQEMGRMPAGAVELIRSILRQYYVPGEEQMNIPMNELVKCFALMCVAPYYGEFGDDGDRKADKIIEQVRQVPAVIAYPLINFFLGIWQRKPQSGTNAWAKVLPLLNWRQESKA